MKKHMKLKKFAILMVILILLIIIVEIPIANQKELKLAFNNTVENGKLTTRIYTVTADDEQQIRRNIWNTLNIQAPSLSFRPADFYLERSQLDKTYAELTFIYHKNLFTVYMSKHGYQSDEIEDAEVIDNVQVFELNIETDILKNNEGFYLARFEYDGTSYELFSTLKEKDFIKMVEGIYF